MGAPVWVGPVDYFVNTGQPTNALLFVNTATGKGPTKNKWTKLDVTKPPWNIPHEANSAFLTGILIITYPAPQQGIADLQVSFRVPGSGAQVSYVGQTAEAKAGNGMRSNMSIRVPLKDGKLEWKWNALGAAAPASFGINLHIQDYTMPRQSELTEGMTM